MKKSKRTKTKTPLTLKILTIFSVGSFIVGCSHTPTPEENRAQALVVPTAAERIQELRTLEGYTVSEAKQNFALMGDPNDISISACHAENGSLIPELNQLRLRLINDYNHRAGKKFINTYNHQTLYPREH